MMTALVVIQSITMLFIVALYGAFNRILKGLTALMRAAALNAANQPRPATRPFDYESEGMVVDDASNGTRTHD